LPPLCPPPPAALVLWFWYGLALTRRAQDPETG
jgi:hypothetical protein